MRNGVGRLKLKTSAEAEVVAGPEARSAEVLRRGLLEGTEVTSSCCTLADRDRA